MGWSAHIPFDKIVMLIMGVFFSSVRKCTHLNPLPPLINLSTISANFYEFLFIYRGQGTEEIIGKIYK